MSQINYEDRVNIHDSTYELQGDKKIISVDIDNDNDLDLLVYNTVHFSQIYWYENVNGDFTHNPRHFIGELNYLDNVVIGNIDGDGLLDVVAFSSLDRVIVWFKNLNENNFSEQQEIIALPDQFSRPTSAYLEDIDEDGKLDVIFGTENGGGLYSMKNLGEGVFENPISITNQINGTVRTIKLFDINNDGKKDIFLGMSNGNLYFLQKFDNELFGNPDLIDSNSAFGIGFDFLDFNNDDIVDIIIADEYNERLGYINTFINSNTDEISFSNFILIQNFDEIVNIKVKDHDNDGFDDIYVTIQNELLFLKNTGDGALENPVTISNYLNFPLHFVVEDFDSDQFPDIIVCSTASSSQIPSRVSVFYHTSNNNYFEQYIDYNFKVGKNIFVKDFDNDGNLDIINLGLSSLVWFQNRENLELSSYKIIKESILGQNEVILEIIIEDLNNDGFLDFIATYEGKRTMKVFINDQNNNFINTTQFNFQYPDQFNSIKVWDFDEDGFKDIFFLNNDSTTRLYWIKNLNGLNFESLENRQQIELPDSFYHIIKYEFDDINNDGLIDIIGGSDNSSIDWFKNLGNNNFQSFIIQNSLQISDFVLYDFNNDGHTDILVYENEGNLESPITYFKNNQNETFTSNVIDQQIASSMTLDDINNDGLTDIIAVSEEYNNNQGDKIFYYLNNGQGFDSKTVIEHFNNHYSQRGVNTIDLNNDGKRELITSHFSIFLGKYLNNSVLEIEDYTSNSYNHFTLYPNPFSETINWFDNRNSQNNSIYLIQIKDLTGNSIYQNTLKNNHLDLKFLSKGVYLFTIQSNGNSSTYKIIKK